MAFKKIKSFKQNVSLRENETGTLRLYRTGMWRGTEIIGAKDTTRILAAILMGQRIVCGQVSTYPKGDKWGEQSISFQYSPGVMLLVGCWYVGEEELPRIERWVRRNIEV